LFYHQGEIVCVYHHIMNPQNCFVVQRFLRAEEYVDKDSSLVECYAMSFCKFTNMWKEGSACIFRVKHSYKSYCTSTWMFKCLSVRGLSPCFISMYFSDIISFMVRIHKLFKNLGAASKFWAPERLHKASFIRRYRTKFIRPGDLTPRIRASLFMGIKYWMRMLYNTSLLSNESMNSWPTVVL
jgi:hypothetical protein